MSKKPARRDKAETDPSESEDVASLEPTAEQNPITEEPPAEGEAAQTETSTSDTETDSNPPAENQGENATTRSTLLDEVEAFFHQREALAEKLAQEIEATEARLNELRETMANLYPERAAGAAKDRKPKKLKKAPPRNAADSEERKPG
ncbi:MAG: hypothetical protein R3C05_12750 [Pirellulaceae bacterium]